MSFRVGFGYDTHQLVEDRALILGGVEIPYEKGLQGHSDADALLHAICDALLGAAGLRDIGFHFPDTDPNYKGIDSEILLKKTWELLKAEAYSFGNLDATIIAEAPKMNPHIPAMQNIIAEILETAPSKISIKATTNERMDAPGEGKSIVVHAVVLIETA